MAVLTWQKRLELQKSWSEVRNELSKAMNEISMSRDLFMDGKQQARTIEEVEKRMAEILMNLGEGVGEIMRKAFGDDGWRDSAT